MSDEVRREKFKQLRDVIAWELEAQRAMKRGDDDLAILLADSILDFFDVELLPGADLNGLR